MSVTIDERKQLRMVTCTGCNAKVFIPGDLRPLSTTPCPKCGTPDHDADEAAAV